MFVLKKIISSLFNPISLVLLLSGIGLLMVCFTSRKKLGKILSLTGIILLAFCSYTPTADILIESLKNQYPPYVYNDSLDNNNMPKFIVVLGAGSNSNPSLPIVSRISNDSLIRLIEGIRIYRLMPERKLLLSGGESYGTGSTAQSMAQLAVALGVNEKDIILEKRSRDTKDQADIIYSMLRDEPFFLVTSSAHMSRSMALFRKLGMQPVPAPTRSIEEKLLNRTPNPFFPSSINLQKSEMAFHEYLGMIWGKLRNQI